MRRYYRYLLVFVALLSILFMVSPVYAIGNPNAIGFGTGTLPLYKVFENVIETGDMLFVAEGNVYYAATPSEKASEAFLFQILDTAGTSVLLSTPLNSYGDRPISIYQTAAQVTALGLVSGTAYGFRITGNPLLFASPTGNTVTAFLTPSDYVDQLLGADDGIAENNPLRNFLMIMAGNIETNDLAKGIIATRVYIVTVQGVRYVTLIGGDIFIEGIPAITTFCAVLFQAGLQPLTGDVPESTGAYASTLTVLQKWGATTASGVSMLGTYLGISSELAGSVILFGLSMLFAVYIYRRTQSGITVLLMIAAVPFFGAYLGLMSVALAFIFVIFVVLPMGYFFFSRGAL